MLKNKKDKTYLLIDMTFPLDSNTSVKTTDKLNKYKDLQIEVERMWGLKTTTVPVVMGALGTIKKDNLTTLKSKLETYFLNITFKN